MTTAALQVAQFIEERPFGPFQRSVVLMCTLICMLDGFDVQSIAFVAPVIAQEWAVPASAFGFVFAAGLVGLTIGALVSGALADRCGRRPVLIGCVAAFGCFSLLTPLADSMPELAAFRFVTGLGLGGALPNLVVLPTEYAPGRLRATVVTVTFCGFSVGAIVGGLLSNALVPRFGWESVFIAGGVLPLMLSLWLVRRLPESVAFLVTRQHDPAKIRRLLTSIDPQARLDHIDCFTVGERNGAPSAAIAMLFEPSLARQTMLIWVTFFMGLLTIYFLFSWLPILFQQAGLSVERAIVAAVILNGGAIAGGLVIGRLVDRLGPRRVLIASSLASAALIATTGIVGAAALALSVVVFFMGACAIGGQMGLNALAAGIYPADRRSTGVGAALGVGRLGSIVGPLVAGALLAAERDLATIFFTFAFAPLVIAWALWRLESR